jgi:hypothetical protein
MAKKCSNFDRLLFISTDFEKAAGGFIAKLCPQRGLPLVQSARLERFHEICGQGDGP